MSRSPKHSDPPDDARLQRDAAASSERAASTFAPLPELGDSLVFAQRAREGDRAAINELFRRYDERIHRIARGLMGSRLKGWCEPDDIVQGTLIVANRKIAEFVPRSHSSILAWFHELAHNVVRDEVDRMNAAKRERRREVALELPQSSDDGERRARPIADPGHSPSSPVIHAEIKTIYDECVAELSDEFRDIVLLRDYAECSWDQIAAKLGKPNGHAAQEAYRRASRKLATALGRRLGS